MISIIAHYLDHRAVRQKKLFLGQVIMIVSLLKPFFNNFHNNQRKNKYYFWIW